MSIVLKDVQIRFPEAPEGKIYLYNYDDIGQYSAYNAATGVWSGFTCFDYDEACGTWIASIYKQSKCRDENSYQYVPIR